MEGAALETARETRVLRAVLQYRYSTPQISPQRYEQMETQLIARGLLIPEDVHQPWRQLVIRWITPGLLKLHNVVTLLTRPPPKFPRTWQVGLSLAVSLLLVVVLLFPGIKDRWEGDSSPLEKKPW